MREKMKDEVITMMNLRNTGQAEGRLMGNPQVFNNTDGSRKVVFTLAVENTWRDESGAPTIEPVNFEAFVTKAANGNLGPYGNDKKGDLIRVEYGVRANNYKDRDGNQVYGQVLRINSVDFKETPAEKKAHQERTAQRHAVANAAVAAAATATPAMPVAPAATTPSLTIPPVLPADTEQSADDAI
jgi:single-strand DNA-binding protein